MSVKIGSQLFTGKGPATFTVPLTPAQYLTSIELYGGGGGGGTGGGGGGSGMYLKYKPETPFTILLSSCPIHILEIGQPGISTNGGIGQPGGPTQVTFSFVDQIGVTRNILLTAPGGNSGTIRIAGSDGASYPNPIPTSLINLDGSIATLLYYSNGGGGGSETGSELGRGGQGFGTNGLNGMPGTIDPTHLRGGPGGGASSQNGRGGLLTATGPIPDVAWVGGGGAVLNNPQGVFNNGNGSDQQGTNGCPHGGGGGGCGFNTNINLVGFATSGAGGAVIINWIIPSE